MDPTVVISRHYEQHSAQAAEAANNPLINGNAIAKRCDNWRILALSWVSSLYYLEKYHNFSQIKQPHSSKIFWWFRWWIALFLIQENISHPNVSITNNVNFSLESSFSKKLWHHKTWLANAIWQFYGFKENNKMGDMKWCHVFTQNALYTRLRRFVGRCTYVVAFRRLCLRMNVKTTWDKY